MEKFYNLTYGIKFLFFKPTELYSVFDFCHIRLYKPNLIILFDFFDDAQNLYMYLYQLKIIYCAETLV